MEKVIKTTINAKTGKEEIIERELTEQEIAEIKKNKAEFEKQNRIAEITTRLDALDKDFRQADLGAVIEDLDERKAEFITLHNELRTLQGKPLRVYEV
jgi:hypothetical protein